LLHESIYVVLVSSVRSIGTIKLIRAYLLRVAFVPLSSFTRAFVLQRVGQKPKSVNLLLSVICQHTNGKEQNVLVKAKATSTAQGFVIEDILYLLWDIWRLRLRLRTLVTLNLHFVKN
jgi:hypothetical protein